MKWECYRLSHSKMITGNRAKKEPRMHFCIRGIYLATTYSHKTYRLTTIGAEAFHFRVRNGTGWFPLAMVAETLLSFWHEPTKSKSDQK